MLESLGLEAWHSKLVSSGDKYGRLTVLAIGRVPGTYRYYAVCVCSCGSSANKYRIDKLRSGHTTSCGCAQRDATTKHGAWDHPLYKIWSHMMDRCYKPSDARYIYYGKRGIKVCERWHNINNFIDDMYCAYSKGMTIERINVHGNYTPSNCRWATTTEQARNKTSNVLLTYKGKTMCAAEWSRVTGIQEDTITQRIRKGWSAEKTLTTDPKAYHRRT